MNKLYLFFLLAFTFTFNRVSAQYNNPGGTINTCSGTFYDTGGSGGNYPLNENKTTTFCSNGGGCISVTFTAFNTESSFDQMFIYDGPTTGSTLIGTYSGTTSPGTVTGSGTCLTFKFTSDGSTVKAGWAATISCGNCPPPPSMDCVTKLKICTTVALTGKSTGTGGVSDLKAANEGCLGGETQANWYYFDVTAAGTFTFEIQPNTPSDDYDYAIWGPNPACPPTTAPARCSYCVTTGNTGLNFAAADLTETNPLLPGDPACDKYTKNMTVSVGQRYILYIDNYSNSKSGFTLSFGGTAQFDCVGAIPIELLSFTSTIKDAKQVLLNWETASELNNQFFYIERSLDGKNFITISRMMGAGYSTTVKSYSFTDNPEQSGVYYYRLKQVDFDGQSTVSKVISEKIGSTGAQKLYPIQINSENNILKLDYYAAHNEKVKISIRNSIGQTVKYSEMPLGEGNTTLEIPVEIANMPQGMYFITIETSNNIDTKRFFVK